MNDSRVLIRRQHQRIKVQYRGLAGESLIKNDIVAALEEKGVTSSRRWNSFGNEIRSIQNQANSNEGTVLRIINPNKDKQKVVWLGSRQENTNYVSSEDTYTIASSYFVGVGAIPLDDAYVPGELDTPAMRVEGTVTASLSEPRKITTLEPPTLPLTVTYPFESPALFLYGLDAQNPNFRINSSTRKISNTRFQVGTFGMVIKLSEQTQIVFAYNSRLPGTYIVPVYSRGEKIADLSFSQNKNETSALLDAGTYHIMFNTYIVNGTPNDETRLNEYVAEDKFSIERIAFVTPDESTGFSHLASGDKITKRNINHKWASTELIIDNVHFSGSVHSPTENQILKLGNCAVGAPAQKGGGILFNVNTDMRLLLTIYNELAFAGEYLTYFLVDENMRRISEIQTVRNEDMYETSVEIPVTQQAKGIMLYGDVDISGFTLSVL